MKYCKVISIGDFVIKGDKVGIVKNTHEIHGVCVYYGAIFPCGDFIPNLHDGANWERVESVFKIDDKFKESYCRMENCGDNKLWRSTNHMETHYVGDFKQVEHCYKICGECRCKAKSPSDFICQVGNYVKHKGRVGVISSISNNKAVVSWGEILPCGYFKKTKESNCCEIFKWCFIESQFELYDKAKGREVCCEKYCCKCNNL